MKMLTTIVFGWSVFSCVYILNFQVFPWCPNMTFMIIEILLDSWMTFEVLFVCGCVKKAVS